MTQAVFLLRHASHGLSLRLFNSLAPPKRVSILNPRRRFGVGGSWAVSAMAVVCMYIILQDPTLSNGEQSSVYLWGPAFSLQF